MSTARLLKILALQTAVAMAAVVAYLAYDSDTLYEWLSGDITFGKTAERCDLHRDACTATLPDGTPLTLSITPRPIPVMKKLQFTVSAAGLNDAQLKIEMYGLNMNMGRYTYALERDANGTYRGEGMIPSCIDAMHWRANVIAEYPTQRVGTYYTFTTK